MITYGLIGYPLSYSGSQAYFAKKFREEDIAADYKLFPLRDLEELKTLVQDNPDLRGLNVTIPYKEKVIPFLSELDPVADQIGAVNTIRIIREGSRVSMKGYNTDAGGFLESVSLEGFTHALVLGTGGASKAVDFALKSKGINVLFVSDNKTGIDCIRWSGITQEVVRDYKLIINATPLGMFPDVSSCPVFPSQALTRGHFLYDLVYHPAETEFLRRGKQMGTKVQNGLQMLHNQADLAYEIWNP